MKIYITRHGQVLPQKFYLDVQFPAGDESISALGKEQAKYLGEHLKSIGFNGKIYSSPYIRTLETAEIIASYTGSEIIPWAPVREIMRDKEELKEFKGLTLLEIKERFKFIKKDSSLSYPWWSQTLETVEDVKVRVAKGLEELELKEDVLFVGHGASVAGLCTHLKITKENKRACNCSLSTIDSENKTKPVFADTAFLPYKMRSYNSVMLWEEEEKPSSI